MANAAIFNALMRPVRSVDDYLTQYENRDAQKAQIQQNALAAMENSQLRKLQMEEVRGRQTAALLKAQQDQQKEQQRASTLARLYAPITGTQANAASGLTGPTPQAAAMIGQRRKPTAEDLPALIQAGFSNEQIKLLYEGDTLGMPEVARVLDTIGADRMPVQRREDKFGRPIGDPLAKPVEMKLQDLGGQVQAINPYALDSGQMFTKTMTQAERDASARGWAGVRVQQAAEKRQADAARTGDGGKPPPGYRFKPDGSLEAIPGGPADRKNTDAGIREQRSREAAVAQADRVISKVDSALQNVGVLTAGPGSVLAGIPGTSARNLQSTLETIKANLGFAELQAMRDASPTGGALGAIAVQELNALQSTVASLDQGQSPTQLEKSLSDISRHYNNWKKAVSGGTAAPAAPTKTVKRTGTSNGRKVVEYTDGSIEYAD